jgi:hypothetical protein
MRDRFIQTFNKFLEVFFVQEDLMFLVSELGDSEVVIIAPVTFYIEKVSTLTCSNRFREQIAPIIFFKFF